MFSCTYSIATTCSTVWVVDEVLKFAIPYKTLEIAQKYQTDLQDSFPLLKSAITLDPNFFVSGPTEVLIAYVCNSQTFTDNTAVSDR